MTKVEAALAWYDAGCSVISVNEDGTKKPWPSQWDSYQRERASRSQVEHWAQTRDGIGMVCGPISNNIEMFELEGEAIENGMAAELEAATEAAMPGLWSKLNGYVELSAGGGLHWIFRIDGCDAFTGKLAKRPDPNTPSGAITLMESKGKGGFTILAPSGGKVHPSGRSWQTIIGTPGMVPTLSAEEVEVLHSCARMFDSMPERLPSPPKLEPRKEGEKTPGDDYSERTSWADILEPAGWKFVYSRGEVDYWRRPDKAHGISASTNYEGSDTFWAFTSSTTFEENRSYTKFGAYAHLYHNGDMSAAARELRAKNFGSPLKAERKLTLILGEASTATDGNAALDPRNVPSPQRSVTLTDDGNAQLLVDAFDGRLLYNPERKQWLAWNGTQWIWKHGDSLATQTLRELMRRWTPEDRVEVLWKLKSLNAMHVNAAVSFASRDPAIHILLDDLDSNPRVLNTPGGVVDLLACTLVPSTPGDRHTKITKVTPDFDHKPTRFLQFLDQTFGGNPRLIKFIQDLIGYSCIGEVVHQVLPFLYGAGANGKSVLLEIFINLLNDYATTAPANFLLRSNASEHETALARLVGQRLVVCSEVDPNGKFNEERVKHLTGGDRVTARFIGKDHFTFVPTHHLWLVGNHEPRMDSGGMESIFRRVQKVPFDYVVPEEKRVTDLGKFLISKEGPQILGWMIRGAAQSASRLIIPPEVRQATQEYAREQDQVGRFVEERLTFTEANGPVEVNQIYGVYEKWCFDNHEKPMHKTPWGKEMANKGAKPGPRTSKARYYANVWVTAEIEDDQGVLS